MTALGIVILSAAKNLPARMITSGKTAYRDNQ